MEKETNIADSWMKRGIKHRNRFNYWDAIKCYDTALEIDPKHTQTWLLKGNVLLILRKYAQAIECFNMVIQLEPGLNKKMTKLTS